MWVIQVVSVMENPQRDAQARFADDRYRALLAASEAIVSHRDLSALFHELAGGLHQVARFNYLALLLHEAARNTLRLHVLEACEPTPALAPSGRPCWRHPGGWCGRPSGRSSSRTWPSKGAGQRTGNKCSGMEFRAPAFFR
jgi:hypothetical protein